MQTQTSEQLARERSSAESPRRARARSSTYELRLPVLCTDAEAAQQEHDNEIGIARASPFAMRASGTYGIGDQFRQRDCAAAAQKLA